MKLNWKLRFRNPVFWWELAAIILLPVFAYMGLNWSDMTTWAKLGSTLLAAIQNPVLVVSMAVSVWNALTDPTSKGISDCQHTLHCDQLKK